MDKLHTHHHKWQVASQRQICNISEAGKMVQEQPKKRQKDKKKKKKKKKKQSKKKTITKFIFFIIKEKN